MAEYLLDSRGFFWRAEDAVPEKHFAHPSAVPGRLRVSATGVADLALDAPLPSDGPAGALRRIFRHGSVEGAIAGILVGSDERVLLSELLDNGRTLRMRGPSTESYLAFRCMVSRGPVEAGCEPRFRWLELPLDGYEQWLGLENIEVKATKRRIEARYRKPTVQRWKVQGQTLELERTLSGGYRDRMTEVSWQERAVLRLGRAAPTIRMDEAIELARRIEDLLILLADCNRGLDFPTLRLARKSPPVRLYYARGAKTETSAEWHKAWVPFGASADQFGKLVESWLTQHDQIGPGFHLYLGNRRGHSIYPEHRFASLVWGLESLHRVLHPAKANPKFEAKVQRILNAIPASKDRAWAARFLPRTDEPSLSTRIAQLFARLPLDLNRKELESFAQHCARRRHDVSHFGGQREPGEYSAFLADIQTVSAALDLLYHALLLQLVGVPEALIRRRFIGGLNAYAAQQVLSAVELTVSPPEPVEAET